MGKLQYLTTAILVVSAALFSSASCFAASNGEYQKALSEFLAIGPATELEISAHGKNSDDINKALNEIYSSNGLQLFWIEDGKLSQRAVDIITILSDAGSHGLDPYSYFVDLIKHYKDKQDAAD